MLIHKLHLQDWKHMLAILDKELSPLTHDDYVYDVSNYHNLEKTHEKINETVKYLKQINAHILEEETELTKIKKQILQQESTGNHFDNQELERDKEYFEEYIPNLLKSISVLEHYFILLGQEIQHVSQYLREHKRREHAENAKKLLKNVVGEIDRIHNISSFVAESLKNRYKHIKLEIAALKKEKSMVDHVGHNMESWFLH